MLFSYFGSSMYAAACIGYMQNSWCFSSDFTTAVSSACSNSEVGRTVCIPSLSSANGYLTSDKMAVSPSILAITAAIGLRTHRMLVTLSQNTLSNRIFLMSLSMAAVWDMVISCKDSFPSRQLSYMMTSPPHRVMLGGFSVVFCFFFLH